MTDAETRRWAFVEVHASFFEPRDGEAPEQRLARLIRAAAPLAAFLVSGEVPATVPDAPIERASGRKRGPRAGAEFRDLVNRKGGQTHVAGQLGIAKTRLSAICTGRSPIRPGLEGRVRALPDRELVDGRVTPENISKRVAGLRAHLANGAAAQ